MMNRCNLGSINIFSVINIPQNFLNIFRSFDGYATQQMYLENTIALANAIGDMSLIEYEMYYIAGYDSPFKWWDRHNESWIRAKSNTKPVLPEQPDNKA